MKQGLMIVVLLIVIGIKAEARVAAVGCAVGEAKAAKLCATPTAASAVAGGSKQEEREEDQQGRKRFQP